MKKFSLVLSSLLLLSLFSTTVFAENATSSVYAANQNIEPRSTIEDVANYQYELFTYDGQDIWEPIIYKQIRVPVGYQLICEGKFLKSMINDDYYNGAKYKSIWRWEWRYQIVPL